MPLFAGEHTRATARGMAILAMTAHGGDAPATAGEDTRATTHEAGSPPAMDCCACLLLLFGVCAFLPLPRTGPTGVTAQTQGTVRRIHNQLAEFYLSFMEYMRKGVYCFEPMESQTSSAAGPVVSYWPGTGIFAALKACRRIPATLGGALGSLTVIHMPTVLLPVMIALST